MLVREWSDDADSAKTPAGASGRVADFSYYRPTNVFELGTSDTVLTFSADRLAVSSEPLPDPISRP